MLASRALRHQMVMPQQQKLYDYWRSKCRGGQLPARGDIDPSDIYKQLPMVSLTELCANAEQPRFKVRLAGTGFWEMYETEITGKYIDELPIGDRCAYWHRVLSRVTSLGRPSAGVTRPGTPCRAHLAQFWIRLPLSDDGVNVTTILGFDHLVKLSDIASTAPQYEQLTA